MSRVAPVDVLIAGGGPIGLATAVEAALAGLSVRVLEPRPAPIDKACGEGLMPTARTALARLGVHPRGREFAGIRYLNAAGTRRAEARFRAPTRTPRTTRTARTAETWHGLGVRRLELSSALTMRAVELGVELVAELAPPPRPDAGGGDVVQVGRHRARWFIGADGLHSPTREALGLNGPGPRRERRRYGLRQHYRLAPWSDLVEVYWSPHAEAYVTPVADDLVGVAVLCPGGGSYASWLAEFPALRDRLDGAAPASAVRGAGPLRQNVIRRVDGRTLLVGDAAGYVDALTGEGLAMGLRSAHELIACLLADRPQDYEAAWRRTTRRYRWLTGGLVAVAARPPLRRALVPAASRLPGVFATIVDQLG